MKNNRFQGWKDVYSFSLIQTLKGKSFIISTLIICLLILIGVPIMEKINNKDDSKSDLSFNRVYVIDETNMLKDDMSVFIDENKDYSKVTFEQTTKSKDDIITDLEKSDKDCKDILLHINYSLDDMTFNINCYYGDNSKVTTSDVGDFSDDIKEYFKNQLPVVLGVSDEQLATINAEVKSSVKKTDTDGTVINKKKESINENEYFLLLAAAIIVMMFIAFSGESVATSVVTEKSSKVIEYLLINVRPLGIVLGKILAALSSILLEFILIGVSYVVSILINFVLSNGSGSVKLPTSIDKVVKSTSLDKITVPGVIIAIIFIIVGILLFSTLAALAGASVSRIEDMAEGLKMYNLLLMVGAYLALGYIMILLNGSGESAFKYFVTLLPFSSIFIMPGYVLIGKVSIVYGLISLAILLATFAVLVLITVNVYEGLIYYKGNKIKFKDIVEMARADRKVSEQSGK